MASNLAIVPKEIVGQIIGTDFDTVESTVRHAYANHGGGNTVLPHSLFLRPQAPDGSRIIALPAYAAASNGNAAAVGIKWVSSYPSNLALGKERASAVIVLNDEVTGTPKAIVEASLINAARTAASAVLFARLAHEQLSRNFDSVGIVGSGVIGDRTLRHVFATLPAVKQLTIHDLSEERGTEFANGIRDATSADIRLASLEETIRESQLVIFTTTSPEPYVHDGDWFDHGPTVLHISLRDLGPDVILRAINYADDTDHAIREATSLALARDADPSLAVYEIGEALRDGLRPATDKPLIFSPFGLGILDLAVANLVLDRATDQGTAIEVPFF